MKSMALSENEIKISLADLSKGYIPIKWHKPTYLVLIGLFTSDIFKSGWVGT